jgi:hypothetical protein
MRIVARTLDFCSDRSRAAEEIISFGDILRLEDERSRES